MKNGSLSICTFICVLLLGGCGNDNDGSMQNLSDENTNSQEYQTKKWLDYDKVSEMPQDEGIKLELPEFPNIVFTYTSLTVTADDGKENITLFDGMPIWNVYLCDLTGDGLPEFCATVSYGFGIIDEHVIVYDFDSQTSYTLWERGEYDYTLTFKDDGLQVIKRRYEGEEIAAGKLILMQNDGTGEYYLGMESE